MGLHAYTIFIRTVLTLKLYSYHFFSYFVFLILHFLVNQASFSFLAKFQSSRQPFFVLYAILNFEDRQISLVLVREKLNMVSCNPTYYNFND